MKKLQLLALATLVLTVTGPTCNDRTPPTITPITPLDGDTVFQSSMVDVEVVATDDGAMDYVAFRLPGDGIVNGEHCEPDTFWTVWDALGVSVNEWHPILIEAVDDAGNAAFESLDVYLVETKSR